MNRLKQFLIVCWIASSHCSFDGKNIPVIIKPLYPYQQEVISNSTANSFNDINSKNRFYYVENYKGYTKDSRIFNAFVIDKIDSNYKKYNNYTFIFFNKSEFLNENTKNNLKSYEDIKRFAEQKPVLVYYWEKGDFKSCKDFYKDKKGKSYQCSGKGVFSSIGVKDSLSTVEVEVTLE